MRLVVVVFYTFFKTQLVASSYYLVGHARRRRRENREEDREYVECGFVFDSEKFKTRDCLRIMLSTSTVLAVSISALLAAAANASSVHLKWRELEHDAKHLYTYADFTTEFNKVASGGES